MSSELLPFAFNGTPVRSVMIDGEPWFVVSDAAKLLGYRDASNAARLLRPHHQGYSEVSTPSGAQRMLVANEGGINRLIMRSNAPNAEEVQDWFTDEVMPAIRKTGSYSIAPAIPEPPKGERLLALAVLEAQSLLAAKDQRIAELEPKAAALELAAPAIAYHDKFVCTSDVVTVEVWGSSYGLTEIKAYRLLMEKGIVYRPLIETRWSGSKNKKVSEYEYRAYAPYVDWFSPRPQHNVPRRHNGQVKMTLYVRQQYALHLAEKCGLLQLNLLDGVE